MNDSAPRREEMLVMKVGNGITAENVGTIATVMFIESGYDEYDEFENKLTLQQGKNSTYFSENFRTDSRTSNTKQL